MVTLHGTHIVPVVLQGTRVDHAVFGAHHKDFCFLRMEADAAATTLKSVTRDVVKL